MHSEISSLSQILQAIATLKNTPCVCCSVLKVQEKLHEEKANDLHANI